MYCRLDLASQASPGWIVMELSGTSENRLT